MIHSIDHARAALRAAARLGVPVTLISAPGAAATVGPGWFQAVVEEARRDFPAVALAAVLDCGDKPGHVMAAFRQGLKAVRFTGPRRLRDKLGDLAAQHGAQLLTGRVEACDLLDESDPEAACESWLASREK